MIYNMPYIEDENGDHILDEDGNKIEYTMTYESIDPNHKHKEPIHVNDDGDIDTEDRHMAIKDAAEDKHATSLGQIKILLNNLKDEINNQPQDDPTPQIMNQVMNEINKTKTAIHNDIGEDINMISTKMSQLESKINNDIQSISSKVNDNDHNINTLNNKLTSELAIINNKLTSELTRIGNELSDKISNDIKITVNKIFNPE